MPVRAHMPGPRNLGLLILPAIVLPLAGLGASALGQELPIHGHRAVAAAAELRPGTVEPTPFYVKPFQVPLPIPPVLRPVRSGDVEIWELVNKGGGWTHPVHIHLTGFQMLDRNGGPPEPWEGSNKETFLLRENDVVRVIGRFDGITSAGPDRPIWERAFVYHCHNLEHEDFAMMAQFEPVHPSAHTPTPGARSRPPSESYSAPAPVPNPLAPLVPALMPFTTPMVETPLSATGTERKRP